MFPFIAMCRLTSEASTLFINVRWTLLSFKMKFSKLYFYNGIIVLIMFGLFRVIPIVPIWYSFISLIGNFQWNEINNFFIDLI